MERFETDTVVLGLGAMGSAALYHLALRGIPAVGLERFAHVHDRGSTHGTSRVFRVLYPQALYTEMGRGAQAQWRELERRAGVSLLSLCGQMVMAHPDNAPLKTGVEVLASLEEEHALLSPEEIRGRFPSLHPPAGKIGCWIPRAGILAPEDALRALIGVAREKGARILDQRQVQGLEHRGNGFEIAADDIRIRCQRVICTAGAWTAGLFPAIVPNLKVTRQQRFHFQCEDMSDLQPAHVPVYGDYDREFYGFPTWRKTLVVADDTQGDTVDPDAVDRNPDPQVRDRLTQWVEELFPDRSWRHVRTETCLYTNTPDDGFVLDWHPAWPGLVMGAGFSGHGFKFTPLIGSLLVQMVLGEELSYAIDPLRLHPERQLTARPGET